MKRQDNRLANSTGNTSTNFTNSSNLESAHSSLFSSQLFKKPNSSSLTNIFSGGSVNYPAIDQLTFHFERLFMENQLDELSIFLNLEQKEEASIRYMRAYLKLLYLFLTNSADSSTFIQTSRKIDELDRHILKDHLIDDKINIDYKAINDSISTLKAFRQILQEDFVKAEDSFTHKKKI